MDAGTIKAIRVISLQEVREDKPIPADWPAAIDELTKRHSQELAQLDGVEGAVIYGGPREDLVQAGNDLDLLIVGSRGYGPIGRLLHGSVSRYLIGRVTCPLLVLPRQPRTERERVGYPDARVAATTGAPVSPATPSRSASSTRQELGV
jgi:nucleotide-binding universal stress UspA family protein